MWLQCLEQRLSAVTAEVHLYTRFYLLVGSQRAVALRCELGSDWRAFERQRIGHNLYDENADPRAQVTSVLPGQSQRGQSARGRREDHSDF